MNGFGAITWLARVGFLVKGVLYIVIGSNRKPFPNLSRIVAADPRSA
jgi:hypothetical protein